MSKIFMSAQEVAEEIGVSLTKAYKEIRKMNAELEAGGYFTIQGKTDRRYFHEKLYGTNESLEERRLQNENAPANHKLIR